MNYLSEGFGTTALKKIFDLKNKIPIIKDIPKSKKSPSPYLGGSITQYTRDLIMTFPMLCDDTLPIETASMISRANERYIISLLQMLFASEQLRGSGGVDVIRKIHKNIKANMSLDDYIEFMDDLDSRMPDFNNESTEVNRARRVFTESLKYTKEKRYPESSFSENSVNDYLCTNIGGRTIVTEFLRAGRDIRNAIDVDDADPDNAIGFDRPDDDHSVRVRDAIDLARLNYDRMNDLRNYNFKVDDANIKNRMTYDKLQHDIRSKRRELAIKRGEYDLKRDELGIKRDQLGINQGDLDVKRDKYALDRIANNRQQSDYETGFFQKMLVDSEVKKSNELAPSLIVVKYRTISDDNKLIPMDKPFICGVKSRLIPTESRDIIERMISKNKTKISFLNLIRATTGEIGFIKDFLFSLNQAKIDSKNAVKRGPAARIWKTLEYRATRNQKNMLKKAGNDASAITVLVINQETVNYMKKQFEFNLEDLKNTRMIMDAYNLLGIIICDEALETAKSYYAGNDQFETQAYSYLEKESQDKSYKKVISLVSQMNGR